MTHVALDAARQLVATSSSVVVLTGAGISTASGIRDFRGPHGVWTTNPAAERLSNIDAFTTSVDVRIGAWQRALSLFDDSPRPNAAHRALAAFERTGKLTALVTQNIDGLHLAAGSNPLQVIEVHGHPRTTRCLSCGAETPTVTILKRVRAGDLDPHCDETVGAITCDGLLKTTVVSFGQRLPDHDFARAEYLATTCDLLLCVGTTLAVHPISGLVPKAVSRGARLVILNGEPTAFDSDADVVVRDDIPAVLGSLLGVGDVT